MFSRKRRKMDVRHDIYSPDGRVMLRFRLSAGRMSYTVYKNGQKLVYESRLGLELYKEKSFGENLALVRVHEKTWNETWEMQCGEERQVRNHYHEAAFYLVENDAEARTLTVRVRVFDGGVAFRYEIPAQPSFRRVIVADELTEFNVDVSGVAWGIPSYQPNRYEYNYERWPVYSLHQAVHTPLTIETPVGMVVAIHEAALYDYGAMSLKLNGRQALAVDITPRSDGVKARVDLPFATPWRVVMIGDTALDLVANRMILNLNEPPRLNFDWVKPIKFMGIWWAMYVGEWTWAPGERHGATTAHTLEYIDACKRLGVDGLLIEGWNNGWEGDWLKNGPQNDFVHPAADFDVPVVAAYAERQGVALVGHQETVGFVDNYERQLADAYQYCAEHGVYYVKSGYAGPMMMIDGRREFHHSQLGVRHYQRALELAAKYHIMLDVHEPIKGTGIERTWPNLLTREGARGQEYEGGELQPSHACVLPFTRLLAGGMDYTSGILDVANSAKRVASTLARQLAYYVVIYSGMQMVADRPEIYENAQPGAYEFIRAVPVNWERTVPMMGQIGEYYVVARQRRGGDDWYVGGVTNSEARCVKVRLEFLDAGEYMAKIYRDGKGADYRGDQLAIKIEERKVRQSDELEIWMAPGGGFAIEIIRL